MPPKVFFDKTEFVKFKASYNFQQNYQNYFQRNYQKSIENPYQANGF